MEKRLVHNPFQVTKPVGPNDVIDREDAVEKLVALAEEGNNARVVAPRRYGKTSIVQRAQHELAKSGEWEIVYVDLLGITTVDEMTARIDRAYVAALKGPLARWFTGLRRTLHPTAAFGGGVVPMAGSLDLSDRTQSLVERLTLPVEVHKKSGYRVHVIFDEFQEIGELDIPVDGVLRSEIQHHGEHASYVFAGSAIRMMEMMFADRKRAFYTQTIPVQVPVVPDEKLAEYIYEKFESTHKRVEDQTMTALLDVVRGHPQRAMAAAHYLWEDTSDVADIEHWSEAFQKLMEDEEDEMKTIWIGLTKSERQTLANVSAGKGPYARRGGANERAGGTTKASVDNLVGQGIIARTGKRLVVVDPFLEQWILGQRI